MKKLLLVFALVSLLSCGNDEEVGPSTSVKENEFYIKLENRSKTNSMTIDMFYSPTGKAADNIYILKGRVRKEVWDTTFAPTKGKGSLYVKASRPIGETERIFWTRKISPNISKLDTGSCINCNVSITYDPNN